MSASHYARLDRGPAATLGFLFVLLLALGVAWGLSRVKYRIAALADTGHTDPAGILYVYKVSAVDVHGNESPVATVTPTATLGVEPGAGTREVTFALPSPNPAVVAATLRYRLPRATQVRLAIFDGAGRLVRELARGERGAGEQAVRWDLRDSGGRVVSAGLYFGRLEADGRTLVRRLTVTP